MEALLFRKKLSRTASKSPLILTLTGSLGQRVELWFSLFRNAHSNLKTRSTGSMKRTIHSLIQLSRFSGHTSHTTFMVLFSHLAIQLTNTLQNTFCYTEMFVTTFRWTDNDIIFMFMFL